MQTTLLPKKDLKFTKRLTHGGVRMKPVRKVKRPLVPGTITHTILKSSKAMGKLSFLRHKKIVKSLLENRARKFFIEVTDFVNMGNHLHLKVRFKDPKRFANFLRTFTAMLARKITGACRGVKFGKFWDGLAYTRVLTTKIEEYGLRRYFEANRIERDIGKLERENYLASGSIQSISLKKIIRI